MLEMANNRLFLFLSNLDEGLKTGCRRMRLQTRDRIYLKYCIHHSERLREFINAMSVGISIGNFIAFANKFDFSKYKTLCIQGVRALS